VDELLPRLEHPVWELEARGLQPPEFFRVAAERIGYSGSSGDFIAAWQEIFEPNEPVIRFAGRLKEGGHRLLFLSNTNPWHAEYFWRNTRSLPSSTIAFSATRKAAPSRSLGSMKIATERFGVLPAETIYIDDRLENIEAGRVAGFRSIHYQGQDLEAAWNAFNGCRPESVSDSPRSPQG